MPEVWALTYFSSHFLLVYAELILSILVWLTVKWPGPLWAVSFQVCEKSKPLEECTGSYGSCPFSYQPCPACGQGCLSSFQNPTTKCQKKELRQEESSHPCRSPQPGVDTIVFLVWKKFKNHRFPLKQRVRVVMELSLSSSAKAANSRILLELELAHGQTAFSADSDGMDAHVRGLDVGLCQSIHTQQRRDWVARII